jgi:acyl-CoA thioesterase-1
MRPLLLLWAALAAAVCQTPGVRPSDPIQDQPGLPRVLLIGSSVSVGYTLPVRARLAGVANVHRIPGMAGTTANILPHLDGWLGDSRWDVIHFTFGLRDPTRLEDGTLAVPLAEFERNVRRIVERLKATGAKLVWAPATPVPRDDLKPVRKTEDVLAYNAAARAIMTANAVAVNDLYAFALPRLKELQRPDNVHFTEAGSEALGAEVAAAIRAQLTRRRPPR